MSSHAPLDCSTALMPDGTHAGAYPRENGGEGGMTWRPIETAPEDGNVYLFWDDILGVIHGRWCDYEDEWLGAGPPFAAWEFHTFDGDYLPDAAPAFWHPLPSRPGRTAA